MKKTNKSFTKRIKVTKKGKLLARKPGQDHFNAKAPRRKQLQNKGKQSLTVPSKKANALKINCMPHTSNL